MPHELQPLISVADAIFPVYDNILSHCCGRLHSVEFPTQRTGNCSTASDFLGLIFTEAGRALPTSGSFVQSLPWPRPPPWGHFLPGTQRTDGLLGSVPRSPWEKLPYQLRLLCHFFLHTMFIVFRARSVGMFFSRATMGNRRTNLVKSLSLGHQAFQPFIIRKQNPQQQFKGVFTLSGYWIIYLKKSFITSALSTSLNTGYKKQWNPPWIFIGRTEAEAEAPVLWPLDAKSWLLGKDPGAEKYWKQKEKRAAEDEMAGWHGRLGGREFEQTPGDGEGQRSLASCSPRGCRVRYDLGTEQQQTLRII